MLKIKSILVSLLAVVAVVQMRIWRKIRRLKGEQVMM